MSSNDFSGSTTAPSGEASVTKGYFWSLGATALPLVSIFIASLIIARMMGPAVVGLVSLTMALATVLLIVAKFGVDGAASRLASEFQVSAPHAVPSLVRWSVLLRLIFTVPTAAAAVLLAPRFARLFDQEQLLPLFRLGAVLILAVSINELAALIVLGLKRFRLLFSMRAVMLFLRVTLVALAAAYGLGARGIIGAYIVTTLLPGLVVLAILLRIRPAGRAEPVAGRLFRLSVPLAVSGASVTIYSLLDKLMLGYFAAPAQVGLYTVARNVVETTLFPTFALVMALRPALAGAYAAGDHERCSDLVNRSLRNTAVYASFVVVVFACLARSLITGLFTESFAESAELLVLFLPLVVMRSLGTVILPGLIAADRAGTYARLTFIGAALNFILNALFIPVWGARGAVGATLMSYLPVEVFGIRAVARSFPRIWRRGDTWRAVKTAAAAAVVINAYRRVIPEAPSLITAVIRAIALAALFVLLLLPVRAITIGEVLDLLEPFLRRRRDR